MSADDTSRDEDDLLAAELAFGLLDDDARDSALARLARDRAFAAAHARWQDHAAAMFADAGEPPRPSIWSAIEARLPANDATPAASSARRTLRLWQAATLVAGMAAVVLGVVAVREPMGMPGAAPGVRRASPPMVAVLTGKAGFGTVSYDPATGRITSIASGLAIGSHAPELWVIPADGRPRAIGVMNATGPGWAIVPKSAAAAFAAGVTIAVSVEPAGGSPTGQPTGPVILTGRMVAS